MKEQNCLRVQEDGVDVFVGTRGILGRRGHLERSEEAGDQNLQLLHVLLLGLHHAEHQAGQFIRINIDNQVIDKPESKVLVPIQVSPLIASLVWF